MRALTAEPDGNVDRVSSASSTGPLTSITSTFHAKDINSLNYNYLIKKWNRLVADRGPLCKILRQTIST